MKSLLLVATLLLAGCSLEIDSRPSMGQRATPRQPINDPGTLPTVELPPTLVELEHVDFGVYDVRKVQDLENGAICYITITHVYSGWGGSTSCLPKAVDSK